MNKAIIIGRLTKDPEVRVAQSGMTVARYTLAVDRRAQGEADFIPCVAFDKRGEFAKKYLSKGMKIAVVGHIQTGSYTNKEGRKVYTTDIIVDEQEFVENKAKEEPKAGQKDDFVPIPEETGLPFI